MRCYLLLNGEVKGPFSLAMIREMLTAGVVQEMNLMAEEGGNSWQPVGHFLSGCPGSIDAACDSGASGRSTVANTSPKWSGRKRIWVSAAAMVAIAICYKGLNLREQNHRRTSIDDSSQSGQYRGQQDDGMGYREANRSTVRKFEEVLEIAAGAGADSGGGELEIILAAVDNTNWNNCGPDLRSASLAVKNIRNGDSKAESMKKIQRLVDLCKKYR
jgi:hypothetical protein